jgi:hypothetical protein
MDNGQWGQEAMDKADILHQWTRLISCSLRTNGQWGTDNGQWTMDNGQRTELGSVIAIEYFQAILP